MNQYSQEDMQAAREELKRRKASGSFSGDIPGETSGMSDKEAAIAELARRGIHVGNNQSQSALSQLGQGIQQIPENLGSFTRGAVTEAVNLPAQAANLVLPKSLQFNTFPVEQSPMAKAGQSLGDIGSFFAGGAPAEAIRASSEAIPLLGKAAAYLGKSGVLPEIASTGLGSAAFGAIANPNDPTQGAINGGLMGGLSGALSEAIPGAINFIKNIKNRMSKVVPFYSPEEITRNTEAAKGSETPLGDIVGSPQLIKQFNIDLLKNPNSGAEEKMANTALQVTNKGTQILDSYLGNTSPNEVDKRLGQALTEAFQSQQKMKRDMYKEPNQLADSLGLNLELPKFSNLAKEYNTAINDSSFMKYEPKYKSLLSRLVNYKNPVEQLETGILDSKGNPITVPKYPTLEETNILSGHLKNISKNYSQDPSPEKRHLAGIFSDLGNALKSDIRDSIGKSGNDDLINSYNNAEKNYKENFAPFLDKDIYKYLYSKESPSKLVSDFIVTGSKTDQGDKLEKLMSKLSPDDQNLVKYAYFSQSLKGDSTHQYADPIKFKNLWLNRTNLGPTQKEALIPSPKERIAIDNYSRLAHMNAKSLSSTVLPATGVQAVGAMKGATETAAAIAGMMHGGLPIAAASGLSAKMLKNYLQKNAVKNLTDEAIRQKLISQMNPKKMTTLPQLHLNALAQALMANTSQ